MLALHLLQVLFKVDSVCTQNIYYRRTRRHDIPLVTDLRILPDKETPSPFSDAWHKVSRSISPAGEKLYLWYKTEKTLAQMSANEQQNELVTELDVLFGDDQPWYGFEKLDRPVLEQKAIIKRESVWITYRKGVKRESDLVVSITKFHP